MGSVAPPLLRTCVRFPSQRGPAGCLDVCARRVTAAESSLGVYGPGQSIQQAINAQHTCFTAEDMKQDKQRATACVLASALTWTEYPASN